MIKSVILDGTKSVNMEDLPEEAWSYLTGQPESTGTDEVWRRVAWLRRGITLRAQGVASMPFSIYQNGREVTTSRDYKDPTGILPFPKRTLWLLESSLTRYGRAYFHIEKNLVKLLRVRYFAPGTIAPKIDPTKGLTGFERRIGSQPKPLPVEEVLYFWLPDENVEMGPPTWSPGMGAIEAAKVLRNVDLFAATFFDRGAIKATLLTTTSGTPKTERERLKSWWQKIAAGVKTAWTTEIVNADAVKAVEIGEGIESLSNTKLTAEKREDIATALGIPQTKLFSNAANYATAQVDDRSFAEETLIPECDFIEEALNEQLFSRFNLSFRFKPELLSIFQTEEQDRSAAWLNYVNGGMKGSTAAQMLGLTLPEGVAYTDLDTVPREHAIPNQLNPSVAPGKATATGADLGKWERKAIKRVKNGQGAACTFESEELPETLTAAISGALEAAQTVADVQAVFRSALWRQYP